MPNEYMNNIYILLKKENYLKMVKYWKIAEQTGITASISEALE